jgi:hypothetical protein
MPMLIHWEDDQRFRDQSVQRHVLVRQMYRDALEFRL